jgi:hypothetical protein
MACLERRCACRVRCRCVAASRRPPEPHAIVSGSSSLDLGNRPRPVDRSARLSWLSIVSRKFCRRWNRSATCRAWGAPLARALRIQAAAVAADDFDLRMLPKPFGCPGGCAILQHVDDLAPLEVNDNSPGVVTLTDQGARGRISAARTDSGGDAGRGLPLRHGVEAMKMGGKGGATGTGRDKEIADEAAPPSICAKAQCPTRV